MPKMKPNKGLLKRIRVTKSGKVKMHRAFGRHLRSHKSGKLMRDYRKPIYAKACDARRVQIMLPGFRIRGKSERPVEVDAASTASTEA